MEGLCDPFRPIDQMGGAFGRADLARGFAEQAEPLVKV
jgi:hypothetical protein